MNGRSASAMKNTADKAVYPLRSAVEQELRSREVRWNEWFDGLVTPAPVQMYPIP